MVKASNLRRKFASRARAQAKLEKQIKLQTLKENLKCMPTMIVEDNNLKELLIEMTKEDLKIVFTDVLTSIEFYNLIKIKVDAFVNANAEISLNDYATSNAYEDSNNTSDYAN